VIGYVRFRINQRCGRINNKTMLCVIEEAIALCYRTAACTAGNHLISRG